MKATNPNSAAPQRAIIRTYGSVFMIIPVVGTLLYLLVTSTVFLFCPSLFCPSLSPFTAVRSSLYFVVATVVASPPLSTTLV